MFWLSVLFLTHCQPAYEFFKRCKKDVSGRLEAGPCCSERINFDSFPFFLKLRILIIIALSLSKWMCWARFCSAQWLAWELKLETNCKCFSAAEPVCSPGIITVITVAVQAAECGLVGKLLKTHVRDFTFYKNRDLGDVTHFWNYYLICSYY